MNPLLKVISITVLAFSTAVFSGCGRQCQLAKENIILPTAKVSQYLVSNPSGQNLADYGCGNILTQFDHLPEGATAIRSIAENRFTHTNSYCIRWEESSRVVCTNGYLALNRTQPDDEVAAFRPRPRPYPYPEPRPYPHRQYCHTENYTYCGQYQYDTYRDPQYSMAVELSSQIDKLYASSHQMCADAITGRTDSAYARSRDILALILGSIKPQVDQVYVAACQ